MTLPVPFQPSKARPAEGSSASAVDLTGLLCRSLQHEQDLGVELSGLYAAATVWADGDTHLEVNGVVNIPGGHLPDNAEVVVLVEDVHGRVITTGDELIDADKAYGFAAFRILEQLPAQATVQHLRIYPQPW